MPESEPTFDVAIVGYGPVGALLADAIGPRDAVIERSAVYTFHSLIAARWRRGRLLLAGDSCHQTPPFLGQGMCAGMRDAANLAWKLNLVLHGMAGESLLDTYESERRSHVHTFVELAVRLGAIIQATEPPAVEARDRQLRTSAPRMFDFPQPQLGPGAWVVGPPPVGAVFPQPRLDDGRRLDDAIGNRFAVLAEAPVLAGLDADLNLRWPELDVAVIDAPGDDIRDWLIQNEAAAVVPRPDRYVFGLAHDARELAQLTSRLPGCARANVAV